MNINFLSLLRPYSWIKNIFIFVPLFFARELFVDSKFATSALAFAVFCITASAVYIFNDILDREQDRRHSKKRNRPIASGAISVKSALLVFFFLLVVDAFLIYYFVPKIFWFTFLYFALNIFYSMYLKHVAVLDILIISSFYLLRIMVGGAAVGVYISNWLLLCIIFVSLFMISGKRLAEYREDNKRPVLEEYSPEFFNAMLVISSVLVIISYSLYSVLVLNNGLTIFSIFLVLLGIVRYLFLVFTTRHAEYPERVVVNDRIIFISSLLWVLTMYFIIYLKV